MKIVIYSHSSLPSHHIGVLTDVALKACNDPKNEVLWVSCDSNVGICINNPKGSSAMCNLCQFTDRCARHLLPTNHKHIKLSAYLTKQDAAFFDNLSFDYQTTAQIKALQWNELEIGYGALSTYISTTRNLNPKMDSTFRHYFDTLLKSEVKVATAFGRIMDNFAPDKIYLFNGRTVNSRPVFELAKLRGVEVVCMEVVSPKEPFKFKVTQFINALPHDIEYNRQLIDLLWSQNGDDPVAREAVARGFFEKRRGAQRVGDKIYTAHQKDGLLPDNWDDNKENIAIFNSSEDEFFAIGGAWEDGKLFDSQIDGIKAIVEHYAGDNSKHFYLKVHPNLIPIKYKYHTDLYTLSYPNLTVVAAASPVSTYAMMDAANKVVVFGSSTGAEAVYARKAVIQLRTSRYNYTGTVYMPSNEGELWSLIDTQDLPSKYDEQILKFGFYYATDNLPNSSFDLELKVFRLFGRRAIVSKFLRLWGSSWMFVIVSRIYKNLSFIFAFRSKFKSVPLDEA